MILNSFICCATGFPVGRDGYNPGLENTSDDNKIVLKNNNIIVASYCYNHLF
jgi:hypothetical protein